MYTRSERNINFAKNGNPNIGPGTYQNYDDFDNPKNQGYYINKYEKYLYFLLYIGFHSKIIIKIILIK